MKRIREWENKKRKKKKKQLQSLQCGMLQIMKWFLNNKQVTFSTVCLKVTWRANKQWAFVWCSFFKTGIIAPGGPLTCSTQGSPSQRWAVSNTEEAEWSCTRNGPSEPLPATSHKKFFFFLVLVQITKDIPAASHETFIWCTFKKDHVSLS